MTAPLWTLQTPDGTSNAARKLLSGLLGSGAVDLVMVQVAQPRTGRLSHALVRDPELVASSHPFAPLMPVSGARMVSRLAATAQGRRIAALLRPCEERALVELVKLKQASLEDLLVVGFDCPGAVERDELDRLAAGPDGIDGAARAVRGASFEPAAPGPDLRAGCRICDRFLPGPLADVGLEVFGHDGVIGVRLSERASRLVDPAALGLERVDAEPVERAAVVETLVVARRRVLARELAALAHLPEGVEGLLDELSACIRCGACRQACPICFCRRCTFEMPTHEHEPADFVRWAERRGAARLPEEVLLYHLTRLAHVGLSCAQCGACESACPQGLRLTRLFAHVGPRVRAPFDYLPGRALDEPLPLSVFERDELEPRVMASEHDQVPMLEVAEAIVEAGGKALLECLGCGTCSAVCPWGLVRPTSIRRILRQAALGLEGFEPESWRCLTCRACVDRCPQEIDLTTVMQAMRAVAAEAGGLPAGISAAVGSLRAAGNPWGGESADRARWAEGLALADREGPPELAYFACCTPAYDPSARSLARAAVRLLELAGRTVGLLGSGEVCCGDLALRAGRPDIAGDLAARNIAAFSRLGSKLVVTSSPHCRQIFETWYPKEGRPEARHVVEVLAEALRGGRLALEGRVARRVAYHDPCYLGRHAGVYEPPRELLAAVPGLELVELGRSRGASLCCGGGGGGAFRETPQDERHALLRVDEALEAGAEVLATACPLCLLMLKDATRVRGCDDRLEVVDLCEILLESAEPGAEGP